TIVFSASASCSRGTAQRTRPAPASATLRICSIVAARFAVSVLVIVWTATGAPPPIGTPPTKICRLEAIREGYPGGFAVAINGLNLGNPVVVSSIVWVRRGDYAFGGGV